MARKKHTTYPEERLDEEPTPPKSLGTLTKNQCTTDRAPPWIGQCKMQRQLIEQLAEDLERSGTDEVICNIAAWHNYDKTNKKYLTVELSPKFRKIGRDGRRSDTAHFMRYDD
jgi:hypothetical protein